METMIAAVVFAWVSLTAPVQPEGPVVACWPAGSPECVEAMRGRPRTAMEVCAALLDPDAMATPEGRAGWVPARLWNRCAPGLAAMRRQAVSIRVHGGWVRGE